MNKYPTPELSNQDSPPGNSTAFMRNAERLSARRNLEQWVTIMQLHIKFTWSRNLATHAMMRTIIDLYSDINAKETSTITIAALDGRKKPNVNSIGMLD